MPSGGHGGGGGSHFSGGGHSFSSHSSSYHRTRPMVLGHYYLPVNEANKFSESIGGVIFFLFFSFFMFVASLLVVSQTKVIKQDRLYYLEMIDNAIKNPEYQKEGIVTGFYLNEDCDKYYFEYKIPVYDGSGYCEGYSYCLYEYSDISTYYEGKTLIFACDSVNVTYTTDSIDLGYANYDLEDDGEYVSCRTAHILTSIFGVLTFIILVINIFKTIEFFKKNKKVRAKKDEGEIKLDGSSDTICQYCGSKISPTANKCRECGADIHR